MKNKFTPIFILYFFLAGMSSCVNWYTKKSPDFYKANREAIDDIVHQYDSLYDNQKLGMGFANRSFKAYGIDILTDSVRITILKNQSKSAFLQEVKPYHIDSNLLQGLYNKLYNLKCIWISREDFRRKGKNESLLFLSFRSIWKGSSFLDRRYYTLVYTDAAFRTATNIAALEKMGYQKITETVYGGMTENYRRHHL